MPLHLELWGGGNCSPAPPAPPPLRRMGYGGGGEDRCDRVRYIFPCHHFQCVCDA